MPPAKPVGLASKPAGRTSCYSAPFTSGAFLFWCSISTVATIKQATKKMTERQLTLAQMLLNDADDKPYKEKLALL